MSETIYITSEDPDGGWVLVGEQPPPPTFEEWHLVIEAGPLAGRYPAERLRPGGDVWRVVVPDGFNRLTGYCLHMELSYRPAAKFH